MPDLGKYAVEVLLAYGVTIFLLVVIVALTWVSSNSVKRALAAAEKRAD